MGRAGDLPDRFHVDDEPVVLSRDFDPTRRQILDRLIEAAVSELELVGVAAERAGQQLMPETDPEDGPLAQQVTDGLDRVAYRRRVAGPAGQEDTVRIEIEDLLGAGG